MDSLNRAMVTKNKSVHPFSDTYLGSGYKVGNRSRDTQTSLSVSSSSRVKYGVNFIDTWDLDTRELQN